MPVPAPKFPLICALTCLLVASACHKNAFSLHGRIGVPAIALGFASASAPLIRLTMNVEFLAPVVSSKPATKLLVNLPHVYSSKIVSGMTGQSGEVAVAHAVVGSINAIVTSKKHPLAEGTYANH